MGRHDKEWMFALARLMPKPTPDAEAPPVPPITTVVSNPPLPSQAPSVAESVSRVLENGLFLTFLGIGGPTMLALSKFLIVLPAGCFALILHKNGVVRGRPWMVQSFWYLIVSLVGALYGLGFYHSIEVQENELVSKIRSLSPTTSAAAKERLFAELSGEKFARKKIFESLFERRLQIAVYDREINSNSALNNATRLDIYQKEMQLVTEHQQITETSEEEHEKSFETTLAQIRLRFHDSEVLVNAASSQPSYTTPNTYQGNWSLDQKYAWTADQTIKFEKVISQECIDPIDALLKYMRAQINTDAATPL